MQKYKDKKIISHLVDEKRSNKKIITEDISKKFNISTDEVEAFVWDYLCTEKGYDNFCDDIKKQLFIQK